MEESFETGTDSVLTLTTVAEEVMTSFLGQENNGNNFISLSIEYQRTDSGISRRYSVCIKAQMVRGSSACRVVDNAIIT
jgi:hypothetical protein